MDEFSLVYPDGDASLKSVRKFTIDGVTLEIGTGLLKAGTRMPEQGVSKHPRREITLIIEGELATTAGNKTVHLKAGDVVTIPAGQEQHTVVKRDTKLMWMFLGS